MSPEEVGERLIESFRRKTGGRRVAIGGLKRMPGGPSREIWRLDVTFDDGSGERTLPLVLRRDPAGRTAESNRTEEFLLLKAARAEGVSVPRVYWLARTYLDGRLRTQAARNPPWR